MAPGKPCVSMLPRGNMWKSENLLSHFLHMSSFLWQPSNRLWEMRDMKPRLQTVTEEMRDPEIQRTPHRVIPCPLGFANLINSLWGSQTVPACNQEVQRWAAGAVVPSTIHNVNKFWSKMENKLRENKGRQLQLPTCWATAAASCLWGPVPRPYIPLLCSRGGWWDICWSLWEESSSRSWVTSAWALGARCSFGFKNWCFWSLICNLLLIQWDENFFNIMVLGGAMRLWK